MIPIVIISTIRQFDDDTSRGSVDLHGGGGAVQNLLFTADASIVVGKVSTKFISTPYSVLIANAPIIDRTRKLDLGGSHDRIIAKLDKHVAGR